MEDIKEKVTEEKKDTIVAGKTTGDKTESGNPVHNADGTFGSGTGDEKKSSEDVSITSSGSDSIRGTISDRLKTKFLDKITKKISSLFYGAREKYEKIKDRIVSLKNFDLAAKRNKANRNLESHISLENQKKMDKKIRELFEKSELGARLPTHIMFLVVKDEKYKNLHEAGTGKGCTDSNYRGEFSSQVFGSPKTQKRAQRFDFEKYGCLVNKDVIKSLGYNGKHYGDACITFKKENMKGRTTYTFGDSLDNSHYVIPGIVGDKFNPNCFGRSWDASAVDRNIEEILSSDSIEEFNRNIGVSYTELQYHGDITLDDISSIRIPEYDFDHYKDTVMMDICLTRLKEKNIPFYVANGYKTYEIKYEDGKITKTEVKL